MNEIKEEIARRVYNAINGLYIDWCEGGQGRIKVSTLIKTELL